MISKEDLIPTITDIIAVVPVPTSPLTLSHLEKFPVMVTIPHRVYQIFNQIGTDETHTLFAEALFNVSMTRCITGDRIYIKKLGLTDNEVNCVSTWFEAEETYLKSCIVNWRKHINTTLFNNYKEPKTTFSEYKATQFTRLWTRAWLDKLRQKDNTVLTINEFIDHLIKTHVNLDKGWLNLWQRYQVPGEKSLDFLEMVAECADEAISGIDEAPYVQEPEPQGEFLPSDGLRAIITGPSGNRYPSAKRRKGFK